MSRAGKFIPGGAARKTAGLEDVNARTGPIRAPGSEGSESPKPNKRLFPKGSSLIKPVPKNRRLPITILSALMCCVLVSVGWYLLAFVPMRQANQQAQAEIAAMQKKQAEDLAAAAAAAKAKADAKATLTVDTRPSGASVTIGDANKSAPAEFNDLTPGKVTVLIQSAGYEDYKQDLVLTADKPTDLGVITLAAKAGGLALTSPQGEVTYALTGPNSYAHEGTLPDKLQGLPPGDYQLNATLHDWKLAPITLTVRDRETSQQDIKFPFASITFNSVPPGATLRRGHFVLGLTPLTVSQLRPGLLHFSVDLPPYTSQRMDVNVLPAANLTRTVTLQKEKDFIAACGMDMIWIPSGYWAGKYEVRQSEFEAVANYNPSAFRRPNRPVEMISWDAAMAFCAKLTQFERKAGKLPDGFQYTLPTESQWSTFSADADLDQAAMSRTGSLTSTQDVGASEPNKFGIYDTLGNVWEWCLDDYDDRGDHSLRGGGWLSSPDNFPSADTRTGALAKYADRFTGFRVVLVPQS